MKIPTGSTPPTRTDLAVAAKLAQQEPSLLRRLTLPLLLLLASLLLWSFRHRIPFDSQSFIRQLHGLSWLHVLCALVAIYVGFVLRGTRWAVLLAPVRRTSTLELLPSQFLGFTAVALFGRVADLARPYLVARRLGTPVSTQLAVYSIERAFDLAAAAILFSVTLAFSPAGMPHHEAFRRAGVLSLAATLFLGCFALAIRFAGGALASAVSQLLRPMSASLATSAAARLLEFREGFRTIASLGQFLGALAISLVMWLCIALTYLESARAFQGSPILGRMTFTGIMLLLATSLGASLLQLPILGWFTQIAAIAAAYHGFYGVSLETASACGTVSLVTTSLSIIPAGLLVSRVQGISLREAARKVEEPQGALEVQHNL